MIIYTLFGNKDGLLRALYECALLALTAAVEDVAAPDPMLRLRMIAMAYRGFALAQPHLYRVIASRIGADKHGASALRASGSYQHLLDAVKAGIASGQLRLGEPEELADILWAAVHGLVSLELAGHFPDTASAQRRFISGGDAVLAGLSA